MNIYLGITIIYILTAYLLKNHSIFLAELCFDWERKRFSQIKLLENSFSKKALIISQELILQTFFCLLFLLPVVLSFCLARIKKFETQKVTKEEKWNI